MRTDAAMLEFHALCEQHGVTKRPSVTMTLPPARLDAAALASAEALASVRGPARERDSVWMEVVSQPEVDLRAVRKPAIAYRIATI